MNFRNKVWMSFAFLLLLVTLTGCSIFSNNYTIKFNSNGGSNIASITQEYDTEIIEPTSPTKEGYIFLGWFSDKDFNKKYIFSTMPKKNITLYAKWGENPLTTVSDLEVDGKTISLSAYIKDTDNLVIAEIYLDSTKLDQTKTLKIGDNSIEFTNLETNKNYEVRISVFFNELDTPTSLFTDTILVDSLPPTATITVEEPTINRINFSVNIDDPDNQLGGTPIARLYKKNGTTYDSTDNEIGLIVGENDALSFENLELGYTYKIGIEIDYEEASIASTKLLTTEEIVLIKPISTVEDLQSIQDNLEGTYKLTDHIDVSTSSWSSIGVFGGKLDGNGYNIIGLNYPLFKEISENALITDLGLEDVNIIMTHNGDDLGALTNNNRGTIKNVYVTGQMNITSYSNIIKVGGIAGINYNTIETSYTNVNINVTTSEQAYIGGLVGHNYAGASISNTYAKGNITSENSSIGGVVGYNENSFIENSYSQGTITVSNTNTINPYYIGGFIGYNNGSIKNSTTTTNIAATGTTTQIGGFVGGTGDNHSLTNNYRYTNQVIQLNSVNISESLTDVDKADVYSNSFFANTLKWDQSIWNTVNYLIPLLKGLSGQLELDDSLANNFTITSLYLVPDLSVPITNINEYDDYLYTMINKGYDTYTFTCDTTVLSCRDIKDDSTKIFDAMFFYHSYIRFESISSSYTDSYLTLSLSNKTYSEQMIYDINQEADRILNEIISPEMAERDQIKAIHDYVIKNVEYDYACFNDLTSCSTNTFNAYSAFFEDYTVCDGYSQAFDILARKLGIQTHRIPSVKEGQHAWNVVFIDGEWLHIDLTWDDTGDGKFKTGIKYDYFLITTEQLHALDQNPSHQFDEQLFIN